MLLQQYYLGCLAPRVLALALAAADPPLLLDVRTPYKRQTRYIAGSLHLPLQRLQQQMQDVPRGRKIVVYCAGGYRSALAVGLLEQHGMVMLADLDGGLAAWEDAALPTLVPAPTPAA